MTQNALTDFDDEIEEAPVISNDDSIRTIAMYAERLVEVEHEIKVQNDLLDTLNQQKRLLVEEQLPTAMHVAGVSSFTTIKGFLIEVKKFTSARIAEAKKPLAMQWLRDHGHGGLIRSEISVEFAKGKETLAAEAESALISLGCTVNRSDNVHFKTLEKFVKEMHENGKEVPTDLFGVFVGRRATIKQPPTLS